MALWMVRAGRTGEHEQRFFEDSKVYLTWGGALQNVDLSRVKDYDEVKRIVTEAYPNYGRGKLMNNAGQIFAFVLPMKPGDWVVCPRKTKPAIAFAEITEPYIYSASADVPYRHSRTVKWLNQDVPRSAFDQDLLFSFGAFMTVCQISRNEAEKRIRAMKERGWPPSDVTAPADDSADLERLGRDQIAKLITRHFKGHEMARLVDAVLKAQGYTTFTSPPGADKGVDILAAPGALGFGTPRIWCRSSRKMHPLIHRR
jgi:restriction system protein